MNNIEYLTTIKKEYQEQLNNIITPHIYQGIKQLYKDVKEQCKKIGDRNIMAKFQQQMKLVPQWNIDVINRESQRIVSKSQCEYLQDLIAAVFLSNTKILSATSTEKQIDVNVPTLPNFIHFIYKEVARSLYSHPDLIRDYDIDKWEQTRNYRETINIIQLSINDTVRKNLPFRNILSNYLDFSINPPKTKSKSKKKKRYEPETDSESDNSYESWETESFTDSDVEENEMEENENEEQKIIKEEIVVSADEEDEDDDEEDNDVNKDKEDEDNDVNKDEDEDEDEDENENEDENNNINEDNDINIDEENKQQDGGNQNSITNLENIENIDNIDESDIEELDVDTDDEDDNIGNSTNKYYNLENTNVQNNNIIEEINVNNLENFENTNVQNNNIIEEISVGNSVVENNIITENNNVVENNVIETNFVVEDNNIVEEITNEIINQEINNENNDIEEIIIDNDDNDSNISIPDLNENIEKVEEIVINNNLNKEEIIINAVDKIIDDDKIESIPISNKLEQSIGTIELSQSNLIPTNNVLIPPFLQQDLTNYDENVEADDEISDQEDDIVNSNDIKTIQLISSKGLSLIKSSKISNNNEKKKNINKPFLFFNDATDF